MGLMSVKDSLIEEARRLYQKGLVSGAAGNLSLRLDDSKILITPALSVFSRLKASQLVVLNLEGRVIEGKEASTEKIVHLAIYRARSDVAAIAHTHPVYVSAFASLDREVKFFSPEIADYLGRVPLVPYLPSGTPKLAQAVVEHLGQDRGVILAKHGLITVGESLAEAVDMAELIENAAKVSYLSELLQKGL